MNQEMFDGVIYLANGFPMPPNLDYNGKKKQKKWNYAVLGSFSTKYICRLYRYIPFILKNNRICRTFQTENSDPFRKISFFRI